MVEGLYVVLEGGEGEITEKKSRFIGNVFPVKSEEEALACLEQIRKKHYTANHHCFAYIIGERQELVRCSDDGEPSGTAGRPILSVLQGENLYNVLVVVTRYFGGTLLGTGGLVRAYTKGAAEGLAASRIVERLPGAETELTMDYTDLGKVQYIAGQMELPVLDTVYEEQVKMRILLPVPLAETFAKKVTEGTNARVKMNKLRDVEYGVEGKNVVLINEEGNEE
ncbi:YigZ family protein [Anaerolentibacter hominis]|uniref:YigZ family protein n=1 Tax=Anaerolentibacter hominis TaxID=3079009 RepID=UPI0031B89DBD